MVVVDASIGVLEFGPNKTTSNRLIEKSPSLNSNQLTQSSRSEQTIIVVN